MARQRCAGQPQWPATPAHAPPCSTASTKDVVGQHRRLEVVDRLGPQNQVLQELCFSRPCLAMGVSRSCRSRPKLDFTHFERHERGRLRVDGIERPGVPEYLDQLRTVKNLPTPATGGAAPERGRPLLFLDFA